ncbi:MAG: 4'-phosphopantetheinyl transferase superfamily protein [Bacteroidota bacterium]
MINVCYTICPKSIDRDTLQRVMDSLPESVLEEAKQLNDERRRLNFLTGRLMLKQMVPDELMKIERTNLGKPYLSNGQQFNISHSGALVVCAVSNKQRLGVDSEKVKKVNLQDYDSALNDDDHYSIRNARDKMKAFYRIWTQKESLMKADGRGIFINMKDIILDNMEGYIKGEPTKWRIISFTVGDDYEISVCHEWGKEDVRLIKRDSIWTEAVL